MIYNVILKSTVLYTDPIITFEKLSTYANLILSLGIKSCQNNGAWIILKTKFISIILILLVGSSLWGFANAEQAGLNSIDIKENQIKYQKDSSIKSIPENYQTKKIEINLSENIGIKTGDNPNSNSELKNTNQITSQLYTAKTELDLSDTLGLSENNYDQNTLLVIKQNDNTKTTMDRIFNNERIRFNGKSFVTDNTPWVHLDNKPLTDLFSNDMLLYQNNLLHPNYESNFVGFANNVFYTNEISQFQIQSQLVISQIISNSDLIQNAIMGTVHDAVHGKNPMLFLVLVPLSGYILIRSENVKLKIKTNRILSFCFIVLILSSIASTPLSVSGIYLPESYAEISNETSNNVNDLNNSASITNSSTNSTIPQTINSTSIIHSNSTSTNSTIPQTINSTSIIHSNSTIPQTINSTSIIHSNSTSTHSTIQLPNSTSITFSYSNSTIPSTINSIPQLVPTQLFLKLSILP